METKPRRNHQYRGTALKYIDCKRQIRYSRVNSKKKDEEVDFLQIRFKRSLTKHVEPYVWKKNATTFAFARMFSTETFFKFVMLLLKGPFSRPKKTRSITKREIICSNRKGEKKRMPPLARSKGDLGTMTTSMVSCFVSSLCLL